MLVGDPHPVSASGADLVAAAFVFVVRGDVADRFVEPHTVVDGPDPLQFGGQDGRVGDGHQVRELVFEVAVSIRGAVERSCWAGAGGSVRDP